jgi:LmbE family N-acetylglucosaminyl deacetylase
MLPGLIALAFTGCALCGWFALRTWRHRRWFRPPPRRDDVFQWTDVETRYEVDASGPFGLPALEDGRTALLHVCLRATLAGRWGAPWIEMRAGDSTCCQALDRGVEGLRYLNLSPLLAGEPRRVTLLAHGVTLAPKATLLTFAAPRLRGPLLVLAPHPDDAELAAFGLYSRGDAWVVTVTAGDLTPDARRRVAESLNVPRDAVPGARGVNLVYPDGALARMRAEPTRAFALSAGSSGDRAALRALNDEADFRAATATCSWRDLVADLRALLRRAQPRTVATPHPVLDAHGDHAHATCALLEALDAESLSPELLLYVVHAAGAPMYPHGAADTVVSMPPGHGRALAGDRAWSCTLGAEVRARKRAALQSMTAVRRSEGGTPDEPRRPGSALDRLAGLGAHPASLLRRACRPNELFQVVSVTTLRSLLVATRSAP